MVTPGEAQKETMKENLRGAEMRDAQKTNSSYGSWLPLQLLSFCGLYKTQYLHKPFFLFSGWLELIEWVAFATEKSSLRPSPSPQSWEMKQAAAQLEGQGEGYQEPKDIVSFSVGDGACQSVIFCESDLTITDMPLPPPPHCR